MRLLVVTSGGHLGLGLTQRLIPVDAVTPGGPEGPWGSPTGPQVGRPRTTDSGISRRLRRLRRGGASPEPQAVASGEDGDVTPPAEGPGPASVELLLKREGPAEVDQDQVMGHRGQVLVLDVADDPAG